MGKQSKPKKQDILGKGKVTPVQVAFIVDRYLSENNYTQTLSVFRTEASDFISITKGKEAPKRLLSLGDILDEYICLKEQRMMLEKESCRMEMLLQGIQDVMHAYNSAGDISASMAMLVPQTDTNSWSPAGYPIHNPNPAPMLLTSAKEPTKFSTAITNLPPDNKRKCSKLVSDASLTAKKSCTQLSTNKPASGGTKLPIQPSKVNIAVSTNNFSNGSSMQGSSVVKSLFKDPSQSQTNSPSPKTPPLSFPSEVDKPLSPMDSSSLTHYTNSNSSQDITPTNCPINFSSLSVSPLKNIGYHSTQRNNCVSTSPLKSYLKRPGERDCIKSRLDFDGLDELTSTKKSFGTSEISSLVTDSKLGEAFNLDSPNFDVFGGDCSLSALLVDIDVDSEGVAFHCQQELDSSCDFITGSAHELRDGDLGANKMFSELPLSSFSGVLSEKNMNRGPTTWKSAKSTKCIKKSCPVKTEEGLSSPEQDNLLVRD